MNKEKVNLVNLLGIVYVALTILGLTSSSFEIFSEEPFYFSGSWVTFTFLVISIVLSIEIFIYTKKYLKNEFGKFLYYFILFNPVINIVLTMGVNLIYDYYFGTINNILINLFFFFYPIFAGILSVCLVLDTTNPRLKYTKVSSMNDPTFNVIFNSKVDFNFYKENKKLIRKIRILITSFEVFFGLGFSFISMYLFYKNYNNVAQISDMIFIIFSTLLFLVSLAIFVYLILVNQKHKIISSRVIFFAIYYLVITVTYFLLIPNIYRNTFFIEEELGFIGVEIITYSLYIACVIFTNVFLFLDFYYFGYLKREIKRIDENLSKDN